MSPDHTLQQNTIISTHTHRGGKDLIGGSEQNTDGAWVVELIPNRTLDSWPSSYRLKLIDAQSNKPLINKPAHISFGEGKSFDGRTNSLGYIFFTVEKAGMEGWVVVAGYKRAEINWGWVNYKLKLEKQ